MLAGSGHHLCHAPWIPPRATATAASSTCWPRARLQLRAEPRACDLVCGITGNMDIPGGMRGSTPGWPFFDLGMCNPDSPEIPPYDSSKILGSIEFPMIGSDRGPGWADATSIYDAIETGTPYNVTCGIGQTGDFMNQSNSINAAEQLKKLDFWCSIDLWHTPCVDMIADIACLPPIGWSWTASASPRALPAPSAPR
ncbi:MAG: hypothetical protein ACLTDR_04535 [Adlercreutzia equolifaciens]